MIFCSMLTQQSYLGLQWNLFKEDVRRVGHGFGNFNYISCLLTAFLIKYERNARKMYELSVRASQEWAMRPAHMRTQKTAALQ